MGGIAMFPACCSGQQFWAGWWWLVPTLYLPQFQFMRWFVPGFSALLMLYVGREWFRLDNHKTAHSYTPNLIYLACYFCGCLGQHPGE